MLMKDDHQPNLQTMDKKKTIWQAAGIFSLFAIWIALVYLSAMEGQLWHSLFIIYSYLLIILFVYRIFYIRLKDAMNKRNKPADGSGPSKEDSP